MIKRETFEFEGKTIEEAINFAVASLKLSKKQLDIKVLCEEQKGLFGMEGAKLAKIKVQPKV